MLFTSKCSIFNGEVHLFLPPKDALHPATPCGFLQSVELSGSGSASLEFPPLREAWPELRHWPGWAWPGSRPPQLSCEPCGHPCFCEVISRSPLTQPSPCYFSSYLIQPFMLVAVTVSWMWEAICEGLIDFPPLFHIYFPSSPPEACSEPKAVAVAAAHAGRSLLLLFLPGNSYLSSLSSD